jgi:N-acetylglutamate synthase-like GNAT family acetyltransferase
MKIYKAKKEDISKISYIYKAFTENGKLGFRYYSSVIYLRSVIEEKNCIVIKENNHILGAMCLKYDCSVCEIETLAISKKERNKGLGRKLVDYAIKCSKNKKCKLLKVGSFKRFNVRNFYIKCGFTECKFDKIENCYVFEKNLK